MWCCRRGCSQLFDHFSRWVQCIRMHSCIHNSFHKSNETNDMLGSSCNARHNVSQFSCCLRVYQRLLTHVYSKNWAYTRIFHCFFAWFMPERIQVFQTKCMYHFKCGDMCGQLINDMHISEWFIPWNSDKRKHFHGPFSFAWICNFRMNLSGKP